MRWQCVTCALATVYNFAQVAGKALPADDVIRCEEDEGKDDGVVAKVLRVGRAVVAAHRSDRCVRPGGCALLWSGSDGEACCECAGCPAMCRCAGNRMVLAELCFHGTRKQRVQLAWLVVARTRGFSAQWGRS